MAKKILIGIGVAVAVLALVGVALAWLVDANQFKPRIEQYVHDTYHRTLTIDGDLRLSLFPRLALALPKTAISNRAGDHTSAAVDSARVGVAFWPLLRKEIVVDSIVITGLTAAVERRRDGSSNIDDLIKGKDAGAAGAAESSSNTPAGNNAPATPTHAPAPQFEIGNVRLLNADLTFDDKMTGSVYKLANLNLETGRLATQSATPITLDTSFSASKQALAGNLHVKGRLDLDLESNKFGAADLETDLKGTLEQKAFDVVARAGEVRYDGASGALGATRLEVHAKGLMGALQLADSRVNAPALAFDPLRKVVSIGGLEVSAKGKFEDQDFDAQLSAPRVQADEKSASGERILLALKISAGGASAAGNASAGTSAGAPPATAARTIDAKLTIEGLSGNARALSASRIALGATMQQGARTIVAAIASPAAASIDGATFSLAKIDGEVALEDPALPQKTLKMLLTASLNLDAKKQSLEARVAAKFDDTTFGADGDVRGFDAPRITFEASADRFNLDRYARRTQPAAGNDSGDPKEDPAIDWSPIKALNLAGDLKIGQLQARGVKVSGVHVVVRAAGGRLEVAPLNLSLYGGSLTGAASVDANNNAIAIKTSSTAVNIGPLLKDAADTDLLDGRGNIKLDITTAGATVGALRHGLHGSASLALRDGAIKGINLAQRLRDAQALLAGSKDETQRANASDRTDFSEMNASFAISKGVAMNNDLDVKSPLLRIGGNGQVDVGAGTIDYTTRVSVVGTLTGQDGRAVEQLRGVTVPVKLSGPFEKMAWNIDWRTAAQEAVKSQVASEVRKSITPQLEKEKDRVRRQLKDQLKGLLNR